MIQLTSNILFLICTSFYFCRLSLEELGTFWHLIRIYCDQLVLHILVMEYSKNLAVRWTEWIFLLEIRLVFKDLFDPRKNWLIHALFNEHHNFSGGKTFRTWLDKDLMSRIRHYFQFSQRIESFYSCLHAAFENVLKEVLGPQKRQHSPMRLWLQFRLMMHAGKEPEPRKFTTLLAPLPSLIRKQIVAPGIVGISRIERFIANILYVIMNEIFRR